MTKRYNGGWSLKCFVKSPASIGSFLGESEKIFT